MLKKIQIHNFKSLRSPEIQTAPLNILAGLNSSGKSSVMQALHMAEQLMTGHSIDSMGHVDDLRCRYAQDKNKYGIVLYNHDGATREVRFDASPCNVASFWKQFHFISADRLGPRVSFYSPKGANPVSVGEHGENVVACFKHYERDICNDSRLHVDADGETVEDNVNAWMREICPGISVEWGLYGEIDAAHYMLRNRKDKNNKERPTNVGYGIAYALPIIVQLLCAVRESVVCVENPEAHLHPRGQTQLGALMAKTAQSGIQIFVETHSDHFIDGVRIAVKEGWLAPEDVRVLYFSKSEDNISTIQTLTIDSTGEMSDWPEGFCDQSLKNLSRLARF